MEKYSIKDRWEEIPPKKRRTIISTAILSLLLVATIIIFFVVAPIVRNSDSDETSEFKALLSEDALEWIISDKYMASSITGKLSVDIKVKSEGAIGLVAESALNSAKKYCAKHSIGFLRLSVEYEKDSEHYVSWSISDLYKDKGVYTNNLSKYKIDSCSIEELYSKYNYFR